MPLPFIAEAILQQSEIGAFRFVPGWSEARFGDGPLAVVFFYLTNLGIPFVLALVARLTARGLPTRWFLVAWLVALFVVPNVVVVSAVAFDMNKYFQIMWIAVAILAAWLIRRWPRPVVAAVLVVSFALAGAHRRVAYDEHGPVTIGVAQEAAGRWIETNTPERRVFLTDAFINSPVDLAGRLRITTFGPYVSNLGYDPAPREADDERHLLRRPEAAADGHGALRRDVRALERRGARLRRARTDRLRVERAVRDRLRRRRRQGLAARDARRDQPLGSTTIVTSGVMPEKTLIATL